MLKACIPKRTFTRTLGGWRLEGLCPQHPWGSCDKGCWKSLRVVFAWTLFNRCWNQRQLKAPPPQRNHVYKNLQPMAQVTKEDRHRFEWWPQEAHPFIRLVLQRLFLNYPCTILSNNRLITILFIGFLCPWKVAGGSRLDELCQVKPSGFIVKMGPNWRSKVHTYVKASPVKHITPENFLWIVRFFGPKVSLPEGTEKQRDWEAIAQGQAKGIA